MPTAVLGTYNRQSNMPVVVFVWQGMTSWIHGQLIAGQLNADS